MLELRPLWFIDKILIRSFSEEMQMTPDTYESTKEGIESTKSTGDLATAGEEKTTLTKQTSQNMAETTEIVDNLCDGKIIVIGKNGNFNVLNRFLKIGED